MAALALDAVVPESNFDWADAVKISLLTADGLRVSANLLKTQEDYWLRLSASLHSPASPGELVGAGEDSDIPAEPSERVGLITERVAGWAYRIPQYKAELMIKRMNDLLKPLDAE